jgi:epidermal growth factor receptor substrate 15
LQKLVDSSAGWQYFPGTDVRLGEIFNDYTLNEARAEFSHAEGNGTIANMKAQHVQGKFNKIDEDSIYSHIVGCGTSDTDRKNIHTLTWSGDAWYAGNMEVDIDLHIHGEATVDSDLKICGDATVDNNLTTNTLTVTDYVSIGGITEIMGETTLHDGLTVYNSLTADCPATLLDSLTVTKSTTLQDSLTVNGTSNLNGNLVVASEKSTELGGTLKVSGSTELEDKLKVNKDTELLGKLSVSKETELLNTLSVVSNTSIGGTLTTTGEATFEDSVTISKSITVTEDASFNEDINVKGIASIAGSIIIGDATATEFDTCIDTIYGSSEIHGSLNVGKSIAVEDSMSVSKDSVLGSDYTSSTTVNGQLEVYSSNSIAFLMDQSGLTVTGASITVNDTDVIIKDGDTQIVSLRSLLGTDEDTSSVMSVHGLKLYVQEQVKGVKDELLGSAELVETYDTISEISKWLDDHDKQTAVEIATSIANLEKADTTINGTLSTIQGNLSTLTENYNKTNSTVTTLDGKSKTWDEACKKLSAFDGMTPEAIEKVADAAERVSSYDDIISELQEKILKLENLISCGTGEPNENTESTYYVRYTED